MPILEGWYAGRGFVKAVSRRVAEALDGSDASEWAVLFTAHNVPLENVLEGDPYVEQLQQTIAQLVPQITPGDWRFAFQSKGRSGGEWLEPEADDVVRALAGDGWEKLLVVPVGFVSDNVETLYDLDIELRCRGRGERHGVPALDAAERLAVPSSRRSPTWSSTTWRGGRWSTSSTGRTSRTRTGERMNDALRSPRVS